MYQAGAGAPRPQGRGGDGEVGSDDAGVAGAQRFEGEWGANVTLDRVSWGHSGQGLGGHSLSPGGRKVSGYNNKSTWSLIIPGLEKSTS